MSVPVYLGELRRLKTELEKAQEDNDALADEIIQLKAEFQQYSVVQIQQERIEIGEAKMAADKRMVTVAEQLCNSGICPEDADNSTCNEPCFECWLRYLRGDR